MIQSLLISVLTCLILVLSILFKPSVKLGGKDFDVYWIIPLLGALALVCFGGVSVESLRQGFFANTSTNPIKVLVLFFSMSLISIYLDETGFFEYLATVAVNKAKSSQKRLFIVLYAVVSILTVFTSNDIIILTFTPFICKFCKYAKLDSTPYIVAEFVAANSWSMFFIIGNPTNIYISTAIGVGFTDYFLVMVIPTVFASLGGFAVLYAIFRKRLDKPIAGDCNTYLLQHKSLCIIGLAHLLLCTILLVISGYIGFEMWIISFAFALSLFVFVAVYRFVKRQKPTILINTLKRTPYQLAPTVVGMFIVVLALVESGVTQSFSAFLGQSQTVLKYGVLSTVFANFMNNIPMSVLFSSVISNLQGITLQKAMYSTVIGSNLGALLTPVGALSGIMFTALLKANDQKFGFVDFVKYGFVVTAVSLALGLLGLELSFVILGV